MNKFLKLDIQHSWIQNIARFDHKPNIVLSMMAYVGVAGM